MSKKKPGVLALITPCFFVAVFSIMTKPSFFCRGIFRQSLTEKNYEAFVIAVTTEVTVQLEKVLLKTK